MKYQVYNPPPILKEYVRYFWSIDHEDDGGVEKIIKIFADRFPRLIFQNLDGHIPTKSDSGIVLPNSFLSGIITKQTKYHVKGSYSHIGVSFYPHAIKSLFGIDAQELTDSLPDITNFSSQELNEKLYDVSTHEEKIEILVQYLTLKFFNFPTKTEEIKQIIHSGMDYSTTVKKMVTEHRISERKLERMFKTSIGVSPKKFLRILRFEKAINLLNSDKKNCIAEIAYELDYVDQSHFTKEFKDFSGFTPKDFQNKKKFGQESSSFLIK
ncbi:AraC family transcriptional regulator [Chryseobacterium chendengshani]|uniref:helix-turn-helix domain-containing protein n=1 Tax=Chryseobacterium sp. LJ668 TaxID=2864040 RepID=UPI001C68A250|nr:AraC family transcriptional regulator [Chryseobacterium sp. LJ668]MBW8523860.1 AraC family transcriptional regulator [Chryseobacterium sp. LJ668]QYK16802.1 AraC family transcriptional regulator [Chryseobacterium sp. LJ668]